MSAAIAEICEINPRLGIKPTEDEPVAFVGMSDLNEIDAVATNAVVRPYRDVAKGYTPFEDGDILVAKITPCFQNGKIGQARTSTRLAFGSTEFHVLRPREGAVDRRYLLHSLRRDDVLRHGEMRMTGAGGQRRVPARFFDELTIPLPPINKQRRIAAVLDAADELRTKRREALAKLDTLAQAIYIDMFGDSVENARGWPRATLGEILERVESGKSPTCLDRRAQAGEWGVLKAGAVSYGFFRAEENKALPDGVAPDPRHEVRAGDVLFSRKNTHDLVATTAYVDSTPPRLLMSDLIFRLVIDSSSGVDGRFLQAQLSTPRTKRDLQALAAGSSGSMPNISKAKVRQVHVVVPPTENQRDFASRAQSVEAAIGRGQRSAETLDALFSSLQQRAFRGEL